MAHHHHHGEGCAENGGTDRHPLDRKQETRALKLALLVTTVFMLAEFVGGLWTNSLALLADAGHMLTDAAALALSLFAAWFMQKPATPENTYGFFRVEILAALLNGSILLVIAGAILYESYQRFFSPVEIRSVEMLLIASVGLVANLFCARLLHSGSGDNLNVRGAFLHVLGDILGSVAAILAALAILIAGATWADPLVSALVSLLICLSAARLVRDSVRILLEGAPSHVNVQAMKQALVQVPGVESVHDLHVWTLTSGLHAMTCHAVVERDYRPEILEQMSRISRQQFNVNHTTIQIEEENMCEQDVNVCH